MEELALALEKAVGYPVYWHLCGICLLVVLVELDFRSKRGGLLIIFFWNLLGVFLHELAHLIAGVVFFAKPTGFSLVPHRSAEGWQLGAVTFKGLNACNCLPVALAPLALIPLAFVLFAHWAQWFTPTLYSIMGVYVTLFILVYNSMPSKQDLKVAFCPGSILVYGVGAFALYEYFTRK